MRSDFRRSILLVFTVAVFAAAGARAQQSPSIYGPLPVFELHSGFWINLHHTLYYEARERLGLVAGAQNGTAVAQNGQKTMRTASLTPAERNAWDAAVSYYAANYATKDLLFNNDMILLKNQLEEFEDCNEISGAKKKSCDAGLPEAVTRTLESAGVVYRAHLWADHDRANRRWIMRVAPLVEEQGVGISQRLADIYQAKWPTEKIRVDVSAYANWAGAYTTLDPLRVTISSTDPRNQGDEALEVVFHEASHGIAEPVQSAIARECRQRDKAIPRDLWHALIFYTTGEVIRPVLNAGTLSSRERHEGGGAGSTGPSVTEKEAYTPYAIREGLYKRGWHDYYQLLSQFWQPYLDSKVSFDDAIAHMVSTL